jgi:flagellar basal-body rod modification protein FlgD
MDMTSMLSTIEAHKASGRVANALAAPQPKGISTAPSATTGSSTSTSSTSSTATDITSQDFLTLLVTEMQNQDPTQPTDPNEYIQQLVGVNSLQQLISINQELGAGSTGSGSGGSSGGSSGAGSAGGSSVASTSITPIGVASALSQSSIFATQPVPQNS